MGWKNTRAETGISKLERATAHGLFSAGHGARLASPSVTGQPGDGGQPGRCA